MTHVVEIIAADLLAIVRQAIEVRKDTTLSPHFREAHIDVSRKAVTALGRALHAIDDVRAMDAALERVEEEMGIPGASFIDANWGGIGGWAS